jgi:hypothetical protein
LRVIPFGRRTVRGGVGWVETTGRVVHKKRNLKVKRRESVSCGCFGLFRKNTRLKPRSTNLYCIKFKKSAKFMKTIQNSTSKPDKNRRAAYLCTASCAPDRRMLSELIEM